MSQETVTITSFQLLETFPPNEKTWSILQNFTNIGVAPLFFGIKSPRESSNSISYIHENFWEMLHVFI